MVVLAAGWLLLLAFGDLVETKGFPVGIKASSISNSFLLVRTILFSFIF